jgi:hypothetical protein
MLEHMRTDDIVKRSIRKWKVLAVSLDERPVHHDTEASFRIVIDELIAKNVGSGFGVMAAANFQDEIIWMYLQSQSPGLK